MILVTGASGHVGSELVDQLVAQDRPVRALVRDPAAAAAATAVAADSAAEQGTVEYTVGNLNQPSSLTDAFTGVDAVFLLGGFADMPGVLSVARKAGVRHVVVLSSRSVVGGNPENAVVAMHLGSEAAVRESGIAWTVLRPSGFMSNTFEWLPQLRVGELVRAPFATVPIAAIDPRDIAAVAAAVLDQPEHHGTAHELSGPEALIPAERLTILAKELDRPLRFEAQEDSVARAEMLRSIPPQYVDAFFRFFSAGEFNDAPIVPTVETLTGRPARTFAEWVAEHRAAFG